MDKNEKAEVILQIICEHNIHLCVLHVQYIYIFRKNVHYILSKMKKMFKLTIISTLEVHENTEGPLKEGLGLCGMGGRLPAQHQDLYFQSPEDLPHAAGLHFLSTSPSTRNIKNIFLCLGISSFSFISSTTLVFPYFIELPRKQKPCIVTRVRNRTQSLPAHTPVMH